MTPDNPDAPHQINLIFAYGTKRCLNGDMAHGGDVVVTCNCYRKYGNAHTQYIALAPELSDAWSWWNNATMHTDRETFTPNATFVREYGIAVR